MKWLSRRRRRVSPVSENRTRPSWWQCAMISGDRRQVLNPLFTCIICGINIYTCEHINTSIFCIAFALDCLILIFVVFTNCNVWRIDFRCIFGKVPIKIGTERHCYEERFIRKLTGLITHRKLLGGQVKGIPMKHFDGARGELRHIRLTIFH